MDKLKKYAIDPAKIVVGLLLDFLTDHNGKPSATRLIITVVTIHIMGWGNHMVYTQNEIPTNLVWLVAIDLVAVAFFMRLLTGKQFTQLMGDAFKSFSSKASNYIPNWPSSTSMNDPVEESLEGPNA